LDDRIFGALNKGSRMFNGLLPAALLEKFKRMDSRLLIAMSCYFVLALAAVFLLEGFLRTMVLLLLAILVVKTIVHARDEKPE
jgi:chromate transport protein ChrA